MRIEKGQMTSWLMVMSSEQFTVAVGQALMFEPLPGAVAATATATIT